MPVDSKGFKRKTDTPMLATQRIAHIPALSQRVRGGGSHALPLTPRSLNYLHSISSTTSLPSCKPGGGKKRSSSTTSTSSLHPRETEKGEDPTSALAVRTFISPNQCTYDACCLHPTRSLLPSAICAPGRSPARRLVRASPLFSTTTANRISRRRSACPALTRLATPLLVRRARAPHLARHRRGLLRIRVFGGEDAELVPSLLSTAGALPSVSFLERRALALAAHLNTFIDRTNPHSLSPLRARCCPQNHSSVSSRLYTIRYEPASPIPAFVWRCHHGSRLCPARCSAACGHSFDFATPHYLPLPVVVYHAPHKGARTVVLLLHVRLAEVIHVYLL
ncbi:hypothetical protein DFH06DRAFT_1435751 [Mycena polygramma]|nr:hypothetical protein DFH06DRAFT_1435751 [Mycena polygramma]